MLAYKYNTAYSSSLKTTPYRILFGRNPGDDGTGEENEAYRKRMVPTTKRQFRWHISDRAIVDEPNETRNKACPNRDEVVEVVSFLGNGKVVVIGRTSRKDRVVALSQLRRAYFL